MIKYSHHLTWEKATSCNQAVPTVHANKMGTRCKHISIKQCHASEHKHAKKDNYLRLLIFSSALRNPIKTVRTVLRFEGQLKLTCNNAAKPETWIGLWWPNLTGFPQLIDENENSSKNQFVRRFNRFGTVWHKFSLLGAARLKQTRIDQNGANSATGPPLLTPTISHIYNTLVQKCIMRRRFAFSLRRGCSAIRAPSRWAPVSSVHCSNGHVLFVE